MICQPIGGSGGGSLSDTERRKDPRKHVLCRGFAGDLTEVTKRVVETDENHFFAYSLVE